MGLVSRSNLSLKKFFAQLQKTDLAALLILVSFTIGTIEFMNRMPILQPMEPIMPTLGLVISLVLIMIFPVTSFGVRIRLAESKPVKVFGFLSVSIAIFFYCTLMWPYWTLFVLNFVKYPNLDRFWSLFNIFIAHLAFPMIIASTVVAIGMSILSMLAIFRRLFPIISGSIISEKAAPNLSVLVSSSLKWWTITIILIAIIWLIQMLAEGVYKK